MRIIQAIAVLVVVAFGAVSVAEAACGSSQRLKRDKAECLSEKFDNKGGNIFKKAEYWARNDCHRWGTVVAKIDKKTASDRTWHLTTGTARESSGVSRINNIYCCKDLSDLCNKSDVLTAAGCHEQYEDTQADFYCSNAS